MLSVAVCTRDRAASLATTLESLVTATAHAQPGFELLVVNNGSSDGTAGVIEDFRSRLPMLRPVEEPAEGLSNARNRALKEFRGQWLAFTDDDAVVDPQWLAALQRAIAADGGPDYLGGRSLASWSTSPPRWLTRPDPPFIAGLLCHYDLGPEDRDYEPADPLPFGVNLALSRDLVQATGTFRTDLGAGTGARGEETEYLARAVAAGRRGRYLASATVHHAADPARLTVPALYRHGVAKGRGLARTGHTPAERPTGLREATTLLRALAQGLKGNGENLRIGVVNAGIVRGLRED